MERCKLIIYKSVSKAEAKELFDDLLTRGLDSFMNDELSQEFLSWRENLLEAHHGLIMSKIKNSSYQYDLKFGMYLYSFFHEEKINIRIASDDGFWRFLGLKVIPDIVYNRWDLNEARYWRERSRIWLKSLWWYIHLSWQGNKDDTFEILKNNSTDTIVQLLERPGLGYRTDFIRILMREYHFTISLPKYEKYKSDFFRRLLKLNTARLKVIEPSFMNDNEAESEVEYVWDLIESLDEKEQ